MLVIPGTTTQILSVKVARSLNCTLIQTTVKKFPDGETYVKINGDLSNEQVVLIQTISPPQDEHLLELFLLIEAITNLKPKELIVVLPYFAYGRQDKRFLEGEALSSKIIAEIIEQIGGTTLSRVYTFDIHSPRILKFFKNARAESLSALPLFADYFREKDVKDIIVLAPDEGALDRAKFLAKELNATFSHLEKSRDRVTGEITVKVKNLSVSGKSVIIIDDIISTGGTMIKAIEIIKSQGGKDIYVACTHPLLIKDAKYRIFNAGAREIVGTDSIPSECSQISLATEIARVLRQK
ncbi:MAG: ribose-phosphate diphosphokinase [Candidatus Helarchaeota archaeon]